MKIDLRFAELHAPLFMSDEKHQGKNFGMKLDAKKHSGIRMLYDTDTQTLHISHGGLDAIIPATNVVSMMPAPVEKAAPQPRGVEAVLMAEPVKPVTAQVSTPQSHVFAGPGGGVTGQEERQKQKPGPKPKAVL